MKESVTNIFFSDRSVKVTEYVNRCIVHGQYSWNMVLHHLIDATCVPPGLKTGSADLNHGRFSRRSCVASWISGRSRVMTAS